MDMFGFKKTIPRKAAVLLLAKIGGGAHKRVDENRELLELLQEKAPQLLKENPWVVGWIRANDEVFTEMASLSANLGLHELYSGTNFPRPWPTGPLEHWKDFQKNADYYHFMRMKDAEEALSAKKKKD